MKEVNSAWDIFEVIHGNSFERCIYATHPCVITGFDNGYIEIMPASPYIDIGAGKSRRVLVLESDIERINKTKS